MRIEVPELSGGFEIGFVNDWDGRTRVFISPGRIDERMDEETNAKVEHSSPEKTAALLAPAFFRLFIGEINSALAGDDRLFEISTDEQFELAGRFLRGEEDLEEDEADIMTEAYLEASYSNIFASKTTPIDMRLLIEDTGLEPGFVRAFLTAHAARFRLELKGGQEFIWARNPAEV
ncbi:MAG TPA: hypothetical protein VK914_10775 [bacterium]|jgi:hypothetical protein|nr:hypothetical protein [bacterium]